MSPDVAERGIVLACDRDGIVRRIVRDDLGLSGRVPAGHHVADMVDPGVREKLGRFLAELQTRQAAYDWEMTVAVDDTLMPLHFAGALVDDEFLILAAQSRNGLAHMNDQLMRINNEQANVSRATAKELSVAVAKRAGRDADVYDELTALNNEMVNLQREMAKKNVELERLNEQKNRLLGIAAHDLRNPLGVILTYSEFLDSEAASVLNEEQREFITTIKDTSQFMLRMVTDILDVTAIEAGQLKLDRQLTDVAQLIRRNVTLNGVLAAKKDITVEFDPPPPCPKVPVDAGKIEQVLNNLIGNAVKFSHRGTRVRVRMTPSGEAVTVAVQDEGQGIPAADMSKLFRPFSKLSVRGTAGEPSTGLGLAIVRRIVEGHGGRIWVDSAAGEGCTFQFTLPVT